MDASVGVLINQIIMMFLLMILGFILYRIRMITAHGASQMADVVIYVSTPALTVQSLMVAFDMAVIFNALFSFVATFALLAVSIAVATLVFRKPESGLSRYGVVFSNCGFIGIPLVRSILGSEYVFALTACNLAFTCLVWTYGVVQISGDRSQASLKQVLANPAIVSIAVGLVCFCTGWRFPEAVDAAITSVGDINTGLVMIVLGTYLGQVDFQRIVVQRRVYEVALLRLLVLPLIAVGLLALFPMVDVGTRLTVLIAYATPVAALAAVFSKKFRANAELGIGLVAMTTLLSMVTMPLILTLGFALIC